MVSQDEVIELVEAWKRAATRIDKIASKIDTRDTDLPTRIVRSLADKTRRLRV